MLKSLTVVLCCYSHQEFFDRALRSLLTQSSDDFEIIIHDNGSSESYKNQIAAAVAEHGLTLVTRLANTYGLALREDILPHIKTECVALLFDDDEYTPTKIERSIQMVKSEKADILFTDRIFINAKDQEFIPTIEEVNPKPINPCEHHGRFVADMLNGGCRLHFSTLVMRTAVAQETLLGDPFYPRIADAIFISRLLMSDKLKVVVSSEKLSRIRIHGNNDLSYARFDIVDRCKNYFMLSLSEIQFFLIVLNEAPSDILLRFLKDFLNISNQNDDLVETLVDSAILLDQKSVSISKAMMAPIAFHAAFARDNVRALRLIREKTGLDANTFMAQSYHRTVDHIVYSSTPIHNMAHAGNGPGRPTRINRWAIKLEQILPRAVFKAIRAGYRGIFKRGLACH